MNPTTTRYNNPHMIKLRMHKMPLMMGKMPLINKSLPKMMLMMDTNQIDGVSRPKQVKLSVLSVNIIATTKKMVCIKIQIKLHKIKLHMHIHMHKIKLYIKMPCTRLQD